MKALPSSTRLESRSQTAMRRDTSCCQMPGRSCARDSRSVSLTEAGRDFYESALRILDDIENATSRIGRGQTAPKGLIRLTVPPTFARLHMVSKLPAFLAAYPDMAVEMAASESPTTIIQDGFDLAIHSGDLPDSSLVARKFAQTMIILVAK